ncbi:IS66 family insertion sequence element accessory protein TnpB [Bacillus cytotoxicus]|nr:IS66 family insertion sequence element accessory protein TnpB [Bacillus cytotoxicus]
MFLFSGWSKDCYKCLYFDGDGFVMLYKCLDNGKILNTLLNVKNAMVMRFKEI